MKALILATHKIMKQFPLYNYIIIGMETDYGTRHLKVAQNNK